MVLAWASVNEGPSTSSRFTSVHVVLMLVYTHIHCHEVLDFLHLTEVLPEKKSLAATLTGKISRNPHVEQLLGAANVKLWTCLARRMSDDSTREESVRVLWTFDEAAQIA